MATRTGKATKDSVPAGDDSRGGAASNATQRSSTGSASDAAAKVAEKLKTEARLTKEQVAVETRDMTEQLKAQTERLVDAAKTSSSSYFARQKQRTCDEIEGFAEALEEVSAHYREREQPATARYVDQAAERVRDASRALAERDLSDIVSEVQSFARRRPALVLGGAVALGFMASRFGKASARERRAEQRLTHAPAAPRRPAASTGDV